MSILSEDLSVSLGRLSENGYYHGNVSRIIDWKTIRQRFGYVYKNHGPDNQHSKVRYRIDRLMEMVLNDVEIENLTPDALLRWTDRAGKFDAVTMVVGDGNWIRIKFWTKKSHGNRYSMQFIASFRNLNYNVLSWVINGWRQANMFKYKQCFGNGYDDYFYIRTKGSN